MRVSGDPEAANNGLFYIHSDHLGSTSVLTKYSDGTIVNSSLTRYTPFGGYRSGGPSQITDRAFTGQRENMALGLYYYNARYYLPGTGRFLSADTIVPDPQNPQSLNRYTYTLNSPLNFIDPSGHSECGVGKYHCDGDPHPPSNIDHPISDSGLFMEIVGDGIIRELFKLAYDHHLPREFIDHYTNGSGLPIHLSESDMAELGVSINLKDIDEFAGLVNQLAENGGGMASVSFSGNGELIATNHGTLGVFLANFEGALTVAADESGNPEGWLFEGSVSFYDTYDFDPKPWGERQSRYAEVFTRVGDIYLPGRGFDIYTPTTPLSQSSFQSEATWIGTGVTGPLSRFAILINQ